MRDINFVFCTKQSYCRHNSLLTHLSTIVIFINWILSLSFILNTNAKFNFSKVFQLLCLCAICQVLKKLDSVQSRSGYKMPS